MQIKLKLRHWKSYIYFSLDQSIKSKGIYLCFTIRKKPKWFLVVNCCWTILSRHHSSKRRVGGNYQVHKHTEEYSTLLSLFRSCLNLPFLHCLQWVYHLAVNKLSDKIATLYLIVQFIYVLLMSLDLNSAFLRDCLINLLANPI